MHTNFKKSFNSTRFRVSLYNLLHKLNNLDNMFSDIVASAKLDFYQSILIVEVNSPQNGELDTFLKILKEDTDWLLRLSLLDDMGNTILNYKLLRPMITGHELSELNYGLNENLKHILTFAFSGYETAIS